MPFYNYECSCGNHFTELMSRIEREGEIMPPCPTCKTNKTVLSGIDIPGGGTVFHARKSGFMFQGQHLKDNYHMAKQVRQEYLGTDHDEKRGRDY